MIKVLIVDDSAVARELIEHVLSADPEIEVIGSARCGAEALAVLDHKRPDVITMDVHMPGIDGFETTYRIMSTRPVPVIIVTAILDTQTDSAIFRTLEAGALAILPKPPGVGHSDHARAAAELVQMVKLMSEVKVVRRAIRSAKPPPVKEEVIAESIKVVAIGASTGGPVVVQGILASLPEDFPVPLLVVQHMAEEFIRGFSDWLANSCAIRVKLAVQGEALRSGTAYVAPGGVDMAVDGRGRITLTPPRDGQHLCPSVNHLFRNVAETFGQNAIGILLTGMGSDGAQGLKDMKDRGALTIAQDKESSVVYGMPGEAVKLRAAQHVLPPESIIAMVNAIVKKQ